jgi:hypothetical protein
MEEKDANKPHAEEPTPEVARLLRILEMQSAARRDRGVQGPSGLQTPAFRYGVLIAIAVFGFGSLGVLEWVLSQFPRPMHGGGGVPSEQTGVESLKTNPTPGQ